MQEIPSLLGVPSEFRPLRTDRKFAIVAFIKRPNGTTEFASEVCTMAQFDNDPLKLVTRITCLLGGSIEGGVRQGTDVRDPAWVRAFFTGPRRVDVWASAEEFEGVMNEMAPTLGYLRRGSIGDLNLVGTA